MAMGRVTSIASRVISIVSLAMSRHESGVLRTRCESTSSPTYDAYDLAYGAYNPTKNDAKLSPPSKQEVPKSTPSARPAPFAHIFSPVNQWLTGGGGLMSNLAASLGHPEGGRSGPHLILPVRGWIGRHALRKPRFPKPTWSASGPPGPDLGRDGTGPPGGNN